MTSDQDRIEYLADMVAQGTVLMKVETDVTGDPARYRIGWKGLGEDAHKEYLARDFREALDATIRDEEPLAFDEQRLEMYDGGNPPGEEVEAIIACLGDDAAQLRQENPEDERAANMDDAAEMLDRLTKANAQLFEQGCKMYAELERFHAALPPQAKAEPAGVSDEWIMEIAHRKATRYTHRSDPNESSYGFMRHTLLDFARAILSAAPSTGAPDITAALSSPGVERLRDFYSVGPVQRAAVESFVDALGVAVPDGGQQQ